MRQREIRFSVGTSVTTRVLPVAEGVSDADAADLARKFSGHLYEREVTPWRRVPVDHASSEADLDAARGGRS